MNNIRGLRSIPLDKQQRELLKNRRHELGLSQKRLADKLKVMQVSVCNLETGKTQPTPELLSSEDAALRENGTLIDPGPYTYYDDATDALAELEAEDEEA